jgi:hypothetical protein
MQSIAKGFSCSTGLYDEEDNVEVMFPNKKIKSEGKRTTTAL